tara:strand:- start:33 stop:1079 length:1047 start_codon:yes stop_codon:yes gene_type:complete
MGQIANEFGYTDSPRTKLGDYRTLSNGSNYPQSIGSLSFSSICGTGSVATGNNQISMSQFRGKQLQQVVNFWSSGAGGFRLNAKSRYSNNGMVGSNNEVAVVGGYRTRPSNSSGTKVHIHVNQAIGSERFDPDHCALRTGSWDGSTTLQVDVGGSGRIQGAGGFGGDGANGATNGNQGGTGTSGLGVEYSPTQVNIASGGIISGGFGGGGGGGGAHDHDHKSERTASGSGGGGGAGLPVGQGGTGPNNGTNGAEGEAAENGELAGEGGGETNNESEAVGGNGGDGGSPNEAADAGENGSGGEGSGGGGGAAGGDGAAIRRTNNSIQVNISDPTNALNGRGSTTATTVQ